MINTGLVLEKTIESFSFYSTAEVSFSSIVMKSRERERVMASNLLIHSEILLRSDAEMEFFSDSAIDILQAFSDNSLYNEISVHSLHHFSSSLLSSSPPSPQLQSSSIYHSQNFAETSNLINGYADFSPVDGLEMKNQKCNFNLDSSFAPNRYNEAKYLLRSFTSGSFDDMPGFLLQPCFDALMESANIHIPSEKSPENSLFTGHMRRVCSTGDLLNLSTQTQRSLSSSVASERSLMEEFSFKAVRYNPEERKERISKYRAKRTQRNFNKTIKYACRKTLADNRPRVRGRFARNDETVESPKAACSAIEEDDDELSIEDWNPEEEERKRRRAEFMNMEFNYYEDCNVYF